MFVTSDFSYTLDKVFGLLADRIGDSRRLMEETCIDCTLRKDSISTATDRIERKGLRP